MTKKMRFIVWSGCLSVLLAACEKESEWRTESRSEINLEVFTEGFDGEESRLAGERAGERAGALAGEEERGAAAFDRTELYLFRNGQPDRSAVCYYDPHSSTVKAEGLQDGEFQVLMLAIKGNPGEDGVTVNRLTSPKDVWLQFPERQEKPLTADYLYGSLSFTVDGGAVKGTEPLRLPLTHVAGKVSFRIQVPNQYTEASLTSLTYSFSGTNYTEFKADRSFGGSGTTECRTVSLEEARDFLYLPAVEGKKWTGELRMQMRNHLGEEFENSMNCVVGVESNHLSAVKAVLDNPNAGEGMMYVPQRMANPAHFYRILQDDEPKEVYYDRNQREFYVNEPIQALVDEETGRVDFRSYCILPIEGVTVYAKFPGTDGKFVRFAYLERMEGLGNYFFGLQTGQKLYYETEDGEVLEVVLTLPEVKKADFEFKVKSEDPVFRKFESMIPHWRVSFWSYGGNPDLENGGPAGNWIGIRPVHIREVIAWLSNLAYMCSKPEYEQAVVNYGGTLVDDNKNPIVGEDRKEIVRRLRNLNSLRVGLINGDGTGVGGLGGGEVFGVYQQAYLTHYNSRMHSIKMYHELGHCMGYGHNSSMTYGDWPRYIMTDFYFGHLKEAIVTSPEVLKSYANPHLYRFH